MTSKDQDQIPTGELPDPYKTQPFDQVAKTLVYPPGLPGGDSLFSGVFTRVAMREIFKRTNVPKIVFCKNFRLSLITHEGTEYKPHNEDRVVVHSDAKSFASIDGMGGMGHGEDAAQDVADAFLSGWNEGLSTEEIQANAHKLMQAHGVGQGGACYVSVTLEDAGEGGDEEFIADVCQAGDVRLIILDECGNVVGSTDDEGYGATVFNAVTGYSPGSTTRKRFQIKKRYRLILASDGLTDNFMTNDEIADAIRGLETKAAVVALNNFVSIMMRRHHHDSGQFGKCDNINIIVCDIIFDEDGE